MNIGNDSFVMLLVEKFFKNFTNKEICDTTKSTEVILALSAKNREQVDNMITKAIEGGGKEYMKSQDYGWMYHRSFEDTNGHIWELVYMDESLIPK
jgi:hypothetical protein